MAAQPVPPDGTIIESKPFAITKEFDDLDQHSQWYLGRGRYDEAKNQTGFECLKIRYWSDGLKITGYIYKPKAAGPDAKFPAIIYNRGGCSNFSNLDETSLVRFHHLAKHGYVILASTYRGNRESEGLDSWGGGDVNDVLNLAPLAESLGYVDMDNLFMLGYSRGGLMTYMALKNQIPVNAAAIVAGVSDIGKLAERRPNFLDGWTDDGGWPGFRGAWEDFENRKDEHFEARSAVKWPEKINAPLLLLHSRTDWRVKADQALEMALKLDQAKKEYELVIYADDLHTLKNNREDRDQRILAWFEQHKK